MILARGRQRELPNSPIGTEASMGATYIAIEPMSEVAGALYGAGRWLFRGGDSVGWEMETVGSSKSGAQT